MQALFVLTLTVAVFAALIATRHSPDRILMLALAILAASGVVEPAELLSGFANTGLATVAFLGESMDVHKAAGAAVAIGATMMYSIAKTKK